MPAGIDGEAPAFFASIYEEAARSDDGADAEQLYTALYEDDPDALEVSGGIVAQAYDRIIGAVPELNERAAAYPDGSLAQAIVHHYEDGEHIIDGIEHAIDRYDELRDELGEDVAAGQVINEQLSRYDDFTSYHPEE